MKGGKGLKIRVLGRSLFAWVSGSEGVIRRFILNLLAVI